MYALIMAGGGGTRLRPLSTADRPKPFLPLLGDETLFQRTVVRVRDLVGGDVAVVTDRRHAAHVRAQAPDVTLLEEPVGRNTAAAIAFATVALDRPDDEVMVVLPADHVIADEDCFRGVLATAGSELATGAFGVADPLVTLGITPDRPATEYGWLIPDPDRGGGGRIEGRPLLRFEEKPAVERAAALLATPGSAWNAGIFLWRRRAIRDALARYAPDVLEAVERAHAAGSLDAVYPTIRSTSIDYAVMEPAAAAGRVLMGRLEAGWSDLGTWTALLTALGAPGTGGVVEAGQEVVGGPEDLVIETAGGHCTARAGDGGSMVAMTPVAVLRGARAGLGIVEALLDRCAAPSTEETAS
jgi:mannose-1-phosphate guanylyltransferase